MIFRTYTPAFPLNRYIQNLVYFDSPSAVHNLDRFLPDGNTEILIDLAEKSQHIYDNESLQEIQVCRHAWVSGVRTRPITIPSGRGSRMLVIAFRKGGAFPFYGIPMRQLTDTVVSADLIFGRQIWLLREQLLAAKSISRMFVLVEAFLLRQAGDIIHETTSSRCIHYALSRMAHPPTFGRLQQFTEEIGYSQKHFIDLFRDQVGISPKQYLTIMRFQKAIAEIENRRRIKWSQIALQSGYYDQAHFIQDFKRFSGFTPGEYLQRKTSTLNYIPVG